MKTLQVPTEGEVKDAENWNQYTGKSTTKTRAKMQDKYLLYLLLADCIHSPSSSPRLDPGLLRVTLQFLSLKRLSVFCQPLT